MDDKKLKTVPLNKIKISDQFWNRYIHLVKDVLIPYQWDILNDRLPDVETSHCIENFKIAAGETDGDLSWEIEDNKYVIDEVWKMYGEKLTEILKGQYSRIQMWRNGWKR